MTTRLSRNRDYQLLWAGQAVAEFGQHATTVALPLLVLAVTGSTVASGVVLGASAAAQLIAGVPAGALADRWNRRTMMLACQATGAVASGTLVVAVLTGTATVPLMIGVAAVLGLCTALFEPAEDAALAAIVPAPQLPAAVALNTARSSLGQLSGTAAGGLFFALARVLPFVAQLVSYVVSFVVLLFIRVPPQQCAPAPLRRLGPEMLTGLRWVWRQRRIRWTTLCVVVLNLFFSAFYLVVIVVAHDRGVPPGEIGVMAAMLGAGGLVGALLAPALHRRLGPDGSVVAVFWAATALTPMTVLTHSGYVIGGLFAGMALLAPTANTTIVTQQMAMTPDELRGRLSGVVGLLTSAAATVGPVLGGALMHTVSGNRAVIACGIGIAAVTVVVTAGVLGRPAPRPETPRPAPDVRRDGEVHERSA